MLYNDGNKYNTAQQKQRSATVATERKNKLRNPFTPNFGQVPCQLAGRDELISELLYAYDNAPGDPALTTILIGARGTGKTALMTYVANRAQEQGWISVNVTCMKGMLEDIYLQAVRNASHILNPDGKGGLAKLSVKASAGIISAETDFEYPKDNAAANWRIRITDILEKLNEQNVGLLITIDEVNPALDEMILFAGIYQLLIREDRKIALLMAGLPHNVSLLLNDVSVSFLRRSSQKYLGRIEDYDVEKAFQETAASGGKRVTANALKLASEGIYGFPFMLQLVGFRAWKESGDKTEINSDDIAAGICLAKKDMETRVLKTTLDEVPDVGLQFLTAMLKDKESSSLSDIAQRMGKSSSYVSNYRKRLLEKGLIEQSGRGKIQFALPMLRNYLEEYCDARN